jgi:hypothetical protein
MTYSWHSVITGTSVSQLLRLQPSTITSMSIDSNMILKNDRFEDTTMRANLQIFFAEQEAETLQCQQLRERAAAGSSATGGASANVSMRQSARTLLYGLFSVVFHIQSGSSFRAYNQNTPSIAGERTEQKCKRISCQPLFLNYQIPQLY